MNIISSKTFPSKIKIKAKTLKLEHLVKSANSCQIPTLGIQSSQKLYRNMPIYFLPLLVDIKVKSTQFRNYPETYLKPILPLVPN